MESVGKTSDISNGLQAVDGYYTGSLFDFKLPYVLRPTGRADCVEKEAGFDHCVVFCYLAGRHLCCMIHEWSRLGVKKICCRGETKI